MSYQINRQYQLIVGDGRTGNALDITNLQVTFDVTKSSNNKDKSNGVSIEIYNLSNESLKILDVDYPAAVFSAGYKDTGMKRLFAGQVTNITTRKSGTDRITQIQMGDAYTNLNHQVLNSLVPPGKNVEDTIKSFLGDLGVSQSVFNGVNLKSELIWGYPLQGTPREMLNELAEKYSLDWQIDDGVLYVHDSDRGNSENFQQAYVISSRSGLIETAYRTSGDSRRSEKDKVKKQSVQWKMLLNPDIRPGDIVKLEDTLITGWYKITDLRHTGDYRGNSWYTECKATAIEKVDAK